MRPWDRIDPLVLALLAAACAPSKASRTAPPPIGSDAGSPPAATAKARQPAYACRVTVPVYGPAYEGNAEGGGNSLEPYLSRAYEDACRAMQSAAGKSCENQGDFTSQKISSSRFANGVASFSAKVILRPVLERRVGSADSESAWREACLLAVKRACAGREGCSGTGLGCAAADESGRRWTCGRRESLDEEPIVEGTLFDGR